MTNRTSHNASTHKLVKELKSVVEQAEKALESSGVDLAEVGKNLRGRLDDLLEAGKSAYHDLEDRAVAGAKRTDSMIHENPYPSLGIAFGVGLLIGVLVVRK